MPSTLSAHEKPIKDIFSDEFEFNIPPYQRPYAWGTTQAGELIDDLIDFMRDQAVPVMEMAPYFLGSIVLQKAEGRATADVVDGQQRLTTLTLLLAALRAHLPSKSAADLNTFLSQEGNRLTGQPDRYRLQIREQSFFAQYVQDEGGLAKLVASTALLSDKQAPFRDNARLFNDRIEALEPAEREKLAGFILLRCFLVVVATPDLDSAYRIFSVMNSRGLDLTASDILKARLTGQIADATEQAAYTAQWERAENELGRDAFVELFGHIRMMYRRAKPKAALLKEFEDHVSADRDPREVIARIIAPLAERYGEIIGQAYSNVAGAELVNEHLRWLNRLEFSDWVPPALAFLHRHGGDHLATQRFFSGLERLAYAMLIDRWGINDRIDRFSRVTDTVDQGTWDAPTSALALTTDEVALVIAALDGPLYVTLSARARSTLLLRLDALLSGGGARYDYPVITVEHVLPQTPAWGSVWLQWFPDENERHAWTHRLGNLALLTRKKNSAASNYDFARKKEAYFLNGGVCPFPLTTQVVNHAQWTPSVVAARQKLLVDSFAAHWALG